MLSNLKPIPRLLVIIAIIAPLGYGAKYCLQYLPKSQPAPVQDAAPPPEVTQVQPKQTVQEPISQPAPAQQAQPTASNDEPTLLQAAQPDAGLASVLKAGKR